MLNQKLFEECDAGDISEVVFGDAQSHREYEILENLAGVYKELEEIVEELDSAAVDKKQIHRINKHLEEFVHDLRSIKLISESIITQENSLLNEIETAISVVKSIQDSSKVL